MTPGPHVRWGVIGCGQIAVDKFVTAFSHYECRLGFYGTKGTLVVERHFNQTPGGRLDSKATTRTSFWTRKAAKFRSFRQLSPPVRAFFEKVPHHPSPEDVFTDALLLDALKNPTGRVVEIPTAQEF